MSERKKGLSGKENSFSRQRRRTQRKAACAGERRKIHHTGTGEEYPPRGKREREREKVDAIDKVRNRRVERRHGKVCEEGMEEGARWRRRTAVATAVEAHEHHFY